MKKLLLIALLIVGCEDGGSDIQLDTCVIRTSNRLKCAQYSVFEIRKFYYKCYEDVLTKEECMNLEEVDSLFGHSYTFTYEEYTTQNCSDYCAQKDTSTTNYELNPTAEEHAEWLDYLVENNLPALPPPDSIWWDELRTASVGACSPFCETY